MTGLNIRAATYAEVTWDAGHWVIVDLGFARGPRQSTAVLDHDSDTVQELTFARACDEVIRIIRGETRRQVMLLLEAPLSGLYEDGNPAPRGDFEKEGNKTRYWYAGLACGVAMAAVEMVSRIARHPGLADEPREVRLVEGFVSFGSGALSDHAKDARNLRDAVKQASSGTIIDVSAGLKPAARKQFELRSIFSAFGWDPGVAPVVKAAKPGANPPR